MVKQGWFGACRHDRHEGGPVVSPSTTKTIAALALAVGSSAVELVPRGEGVLSVSLGQVAALIAAIAFLLLCGALAVPILRLRHTVDAATQSINDLNDRSGPILFNMNATIENVNTALGQTKVTLDGVNLQLARLDTITSHVSQVSANVANLSTIVTSAAASPLAKAAAFGYGVRRATVRRRAAAEEAELRARLKQERKSRRRDGAPR
jgi:uncharacterized protein YoxC